ncbi:MAG: CBS domain-containing protein, partial [Alphaproteobacteria bacterium]
MSAQTDIFRRLVSDRLGDPPVCVPPDTSVLEVVQRMEAETATCAVLIDKKWRPVGIITEQDVTRRIAFRVAPETPASEVMTSPVVTIAASDYLYHAVAFMRRRGLRHIPVLNDEGMVCGMLSLSEALGFLSEETLNLMHALTHEQTMEGLHAVKSAQVQLAEALFENNVPVPEVQALLTDINRDIHARILRRNLKQMESEKEWGPAPVEFSLIILGSGGRGENFLFPDQDNGFILDDYPDADHARIDPYFIELAERMT